MNRLLTLFILGCLTLASVAQSQQKLLLEDWTFTHNGKSERVTIPHDWAIKGPFDKEFDKQVVRIEQNGEVEATEKTGRSGSLP